MAKRELESGDEPYDGREHARVKHFLLETYLERFLMILGQNANSIAFVDGFSGPWLSATDLHEDTSFGKSWTTVLGAQRALAARGKAPQFRLLWIEADADAYSKLQAYAGACKMPGVSVETWQGRFEQKISELAAWIGQDYALVFIDPKGYSGLIECNVLAPILSLPRAEVLINYMWQFIGYAMAQVDIPGNRINMERIFGSEVVRLAAISEPAEKERECLLRYEATLRGVGGTSGARRLRVMSFPIHYATNPTKPKYYLVYASHSATGLITFAEQAEKASSVQRQVFFRTHEKRREAKSNIGDLFASFEPAVDDHVKPIIEPWLELLPQVGSEIAVSDERWSDLLEAGRCTPAGLQLGFNSLLKDGVMINLDAAHTSKRRARFVHHEKSERVRRLK